MGRIFPFLILFLLLGLTAYAIFQTYVFLKGKPVVSNLPSITNIISQFQPSPTQSPVPTPDPTDQINDYLSSHLLISPSKCVSEVLGREGNNVYIWAICQSSDTGLSIPAVLTYSGDEITGIQTPKAGSDYQKELERLFPESIRSMPIFTDPSEVAKLQQSLQ